jgi:hypothetical protein
MDRHDRVLSIVLAPQHLLGLAGVDDARELVQAAFELLEHRLTAFGPFREHTQIFRTAPQRLAQIAILFEPAAALQQLLRRGLVLPEVGFGDAPFYAGKLFGVACGVKDSSADRMRGGRGPDTCEAVRRGLEAWKNC